MLPERSETPPQRRNSRGSLADKARIPGVPPERTEHHAPAQMQSLHVRVRGLYPQPLLTYAFLRYSAMIELPAQNVPKRIMRICSPPYRTINMARIAQVFHEHSQ